MAKQNFDLLLQKAIHKIEVSMMEAMELIDKLEDYPNDYTATWNQNHYDSIYQKIDDAMSSIL